MRRSLTTQSRFSCYERSAPIIFTWELDGNQRLSSRRVDSRRLVPTLEPCQRWMAGYSLTGSYGYCDSLRNPIHKYFICKWDDSASVLQTHSPCNTTISRVICLSMHGKRELSRSKWKMTCGYVYMTRSLEKTTLLQEMKLPSAASIPDFRPRISQWLEASHY